MDDDRRRLTYRGGKLWKESVEVIEGIEYSIAELETRGLRSIATYLRNSSDELFTERSDIQPASQTPLHFAPA